MPALSVEEMKRLQRLWYEIAGVVDEVELTAKGFCHRNARSAMTQSSVLMRFEKVEQFASAAIALLKRSGE